MADDNRPPFGHPDFYAPISEMLRDAAEDADCHAYTDELLFAADEIERLRAALALAIGELSTYGPMRYTSPDQLMEHFMQEARRG